MQQCFVTNVSDVSNEEAPLIGPDFDEGFNAGWAAGREYQPEPEAGQEAPLLMPAVASSPVQSHDATTGNVLHDVTTGKETPLILPGWEFREDKK